MIMKLYFLIYLRSPSSIPKLKVGKGPAHEIGLVSVFEADLWKKPVSSLSGFKHNFKKMHAFVTTPLPNIYRRSI